MTAGLQTKQAVIAFLHAAMAAPAAALRAPQGKQMVPAELEAAGIAALEAWWVALAAGTRDALDDVLAPEFQIMRGDGSGHDRAGYLASRLPVIAGEPEFSDVVVSGAPHLLVVRYDAIVAETRDGRRVEAHAPRLTVFRPSADGWLVVAHANFAALAQ